MRRLRSVDEMKRRAYLQKQAVRRHLTPAENHDLTAVESPLSVKDVRKHKAKRRKSPAPGTISQRPSLTVFSSDFASYKPTSRPMTICHVIESLGLGGAQTMMMELTKGLSRYYGDYCNNLFIATPGGSYPETLYSSYGVDVQHCDKNNLQEFCRGNNVDIVVQHRISVSSDLKKLLPSHVKYILINHTWNKLNALRSFPNCDAYVSVCDFLHQRSSWRNKQEAIFCTILNGIENEYVENLSLASLDGVFKTGRCHRLSQGKFKKCSLPWLSSLSASLSGFHHHLIGNKKHCIEGMPGVTCHGAIFDLQQKMSILKALDVYFYETFQPEGASIAVLESLGCGVPVLCRDEGGNSELVRDGVNGFILDTREDFRLKLADLYSNPDRLRTLKESTRADFDARLHIRHVASRYMQLFEKVIV